MQHILRVHQHGTALIHLCPHLIERGLQRLYPRFRRIHGCGLSIIGGFALIEILLWNQTIFVKTLSAIVIQFRLLKVGLLGDQIRLRRLETGFSSLHARLCRIDGRALRLHVRIRLHVLLQEQFIPLLDVIALLYKDLSDSSESLSGHVRIGCRLDFAGGCH